jgi:hypothetical protein
MDLPLTHFCQRDIGLKSEIAVPTLNIKSAYIITAVEFRNYTVWSAAANWDEK